MIFHQRALWIATVVSFAIALCCSPQAVAQVPIDIGGKKSPVSQQRIESGRRIKQQQAAALQQRMLTDDDFASLRIEEFPQFKVVVLAKGDAREFLRKFTVDPIYEAHAVPRSRRELLTAQSSIGSILDKARIEHGSDIDFELGTIEVFTRYPAEARKSLRNFAKQFPFFSIRPVTSIVEPLADIHGGQNIYGSSNCTTAFSVVYAFGGRGGVATAAHCGSPAKVGNYQMGAYVNRTWGGDYDQQWFSNAGHNYPNRIRINGSGDLMNIVDASDPLLGQTVCKYGRSTYQTCGVVVSLSTVVPNDVPNDPSDGVTRGTFIRVQNAMPAQHMALGGDSGGPVFTIDGVARGIVFARGGAGTGFEKEMLMQPISRLSAMLVSVATSP